MCLSFWQFDYMYLCSNECEERCLLLEMIAIFSTTQSRDVKREIDVLLDIVNQQGPASLLVIFGRKGDARNLIATIDIQ